MKDNIYLVTGVTGYIGSLLIPVLLQKGFKVRCFVRRESNREKLKNLSLDFIEGDLRDQTSIAKAAEGVKGIIHLATADPGKDKDFDQTNIRGMKNILWAMEKNKVRRIVFTSSSLALLDEDIKGRYGQSKWEEQNLLKASSMDYTILIPSQIYGEHYNKNINKLLKMIQAFPIIPVIGAGTHKIQPVHANDVVNAVVSLLENKKTFKKEYCIAGPDRVTYNELIDIFTTQLKKRRYKVHMPLSLLGALAYLMEKMASNPLLSRNKLKMATNDNVFDIIEAKEDFNYDPMPIREGVERLIREI